MFSNEEADLDNIQGFRVEVVPDNHVVFFYSQVSINALISLKRIGVSIMSAIVTLWRWWQKLCTWGFLRWFLVWVESRSVWSLGLHCTQCLPHQWRILWELKTSPLFCFRSFCRHARWLLLDHWTGVSFRNKKLAVFDDIYSCSFEIIVGLWNGGLRAAIVRRRCKSWYHCWKRVNALGRRVTYCYLVSFGESLLAEFSRISTKNGAKEDIDKRNGNMYRLAMMVSPTQARPSLLETQSSSDGTVLDGGWFQQWERLTVLQGLQKLCSSASIEQVMLLEDSQEQSLWK